MTNENYNIISTNPEAEGGNNLFNMKVDCKVWVRLPLHIEVDNIEIHPTTLLEVIKGSNDPRLNGALTDPMTRIEDALREGLSTIAKSKKIGEFIDYEKLDKITEEGEFIEDYIYGSPEVKDLTIEIIG